MTQHIGAAAGSALTIGAITTEVIGLLLGSECLIIL
jgi:hypothetical protein